MVASCLALTRGSASDGPWFASSPGKINDNPCRSVSRTLVNMVIDVVIIQIRYSVMNTSYLKPGGVPGNVHHLPQNLWVVQHLSDLGVVLHHILDIPGSETYLEGH